MPDPETIDADQAAQADQPPPQPAPEAPDNPLAALIADQPLRYSMMIAMGRDPDAEARAQRLAAATGVPLDTARNRPEEVERLAKVADMDLDTLPSRSPATARFLSDVDNASVAHDQVRFLEGVEALFAAGAPSPDVAAGPAPTLDAVAAAVQANPLLSRAPARLAAFLDDASGGA